MICSVCSLLGSMACADALVGLSACAVVGLTALAGQSAYAPAATGSLGHGSAVVVCIPVS